MTDTVEETSDAGNGNPPPKKPPTAMPASIAPVETEQATTEVQQPATQPAQTEQK